jgi:hypothetical protein
MRMAGHVAHVGDKTNPYGDSIGKPEGKRLLERPRHRWEDNKRDFNKYKEKVWSVFILFRVVASSGLL